MENKEKSNLFSKISERLALFSSDSENPFSVERRISGYNTATIVFIIFGVVAGITTKSFLSMGLGIILAIAIGVLGAIQKNSLAKNGYAIWHMEVLEETYLTRLNKRPTGVYVEALDGPYAGKICHLALTGKGLTPPVGRIIEVTVPGNIQPNLVRGVYHIPQYYGIDLVREDQ